MNGMNGVMFSARIRSQSSQVAIPIGARGSLHEFASTLQTMALTLRVQNCRHLTAHRR